MNDQEKAELRRLAEAATGGDWEFNLGLVKTMADSDGYVPIAVSPSCPKNWRGQRDANMVYIAAANPSAVLSLLDECELLRNGANGDFDLDAWLEWAKEAKALRSQNAGLIAQHARDSATLRELCQARDDARKERAAANSRLHEVAVACATAEQERDAALAELAAIKASGWRNHSVNIARGEKCPQTLEAAQAAWDRDQELIEEQRQQIAKDSQTINQLRQKLESLKKESGGNG